MVDSSPSISPFGRICCTLPRHHITLSAQEKIFPVFRGPGSVWVAKAEVLFKRNWMGGRPGTGLPVHVLDCEKISNSGRMAFQRSD